MMESSNHQEVLEPSPERTDTLHISQMKISASPKSPTSPAHGNNAGGSLKHDGQSDYPEDGWPSKGVAEGKETLGGLPDDEDSYSNDPKYDSIEGNGHLKSTRLEAEFNEYKKKVTIIVEEYFSSNDVASVVNELSELGTPEYDYYFVKKLVSMAMDRHDKEKEMAAVLLSTLYADVIDPPEVYRGFSKLVESADDLSVDIPDIVDVLAVFVARAVVDDILPPAFLKKQMALLPDNSKGLEVLKKAEKSYLAAPLHAAIVERRWGGSENWTAEDVKARINELLKEYVISGEKKEAFRCIKGLKVPFFHHEIVKRALIMAMERRKAEEARLLDLLKEAAEVGLINSSQVTKGFSRIIDSIDDLTLDIPDARQILQSFISRAASEGWLCASSLKSLSPNVPGDRMLEDYSAKVFKTKAQSIIREYFFSGDISEVAHCLETELTASPDQLSTIFMKTLITLAMDRKKREREMACVLLSSLCFPPKDVINAFLMLIESADDTALDNPVVVEDLAMFLARAVVDEVLAPQDVEELLQQIPEPGSAMGEKVIQTAKSLLKGRLSGERILRCWGWGGGAGGGTEMSSPGCTANEVKDKICILLEEYESGGDLGEACRCIKELGMPFFHHEVVKRSLVRMIEQKESERLWRLLEECFESGLVTIYQMTKGFKRVAESLDDLSLDVPDAAEKFSSCVERAKLAGFLDESSCLGEAAELGKENEEMGGETVMETMMSERESGEIEETTPLLDEEPRSRSVGTKVPEVEIHLYRRGKGPIEVFKSSLGGWEQDQLEVRAILDKYGFKSIYVFNLESGRGVPIRFHPRNGRSMLPYRDGAVIYIDGEPTDSLLQPITRTVLGVALITLLITFLLKDPPEWFRKNVSRWNFPPWVLACMVIVFTRARKRTRDFFKKLGW